jgi:hypothetical protein
MPRTTITGRDETPADQRFHELRESGYTGPIDQDGYENHDYDHVFADLDRHSRLHGVPGYGNDEDGGGGRRGPRVLAVHAHERPCGRGAVAACLRDAGRRAAPGRPPVP